MTDQTTTDATQRRSPFLAIAGILALLVAGWGLFGGPELPDLNVLPWILVAAGVAAGIALIASGFRKD